jgi:hypothetical protein
MLKYIYIIAVTSLSQILFAQDSESKQWIKFKPIENDFEVELPDIPETRDKDLHTDLGVLKTISYNVKKDKKSNNFLYSLNLVIYPDDTFHEDSLEYNNLVMQNTIEEMSRLLKCPIVYMAQTQVNQKHAFTYRLMDEKSGQVVKGIVVRNFDVIYSLGVFTLKDRSLNSEIDRFIDSFKLID